MFQLSWQGFNQAGTNGWLLVAIMIIIQHLSPRSRLSSNKDQNKKTNPTFWFFFNKYNISHDPSLQTRTSASPVDFASLWVFEFKVKQLIIKQYMKKFAGFLNLDFPKLATFGLNTNSKFLCCNKLSIKVLIH